MTEESRSWDELRATPEGAALIAQYLSFKESFLAEVELVKELEGTIRFMAKEASELRSANRALKAEMEEITRLRLPEEER